MDRCLRQRARRLPGLLCAVAVCCLFGCVTMGLRHEVVRKPARHSLQLDKLLLLSDFQIPSDHRLVAELQDLRAEIVSTLKLPPQRDQVSVYLFSDQASYQKYISATWPELPSRRAYFVGTSRELAVYTFWGNRVLEDLRHEYTHGILHASLEAVPLWLDEGLAEYFEVPATQPGAINKDHAYELAVSLSEGWQPDLVRLEDIAEFSDMQRLDYQESWAWVHFMLHADDEARALLRDYLHELRHTRDPGRISERLLDQNPAVQTRFVAYLARLQSSLPVVRAQDFTP